ncbi:protein ATP6V1FNB [Amblyraja radiata]|uniref:protein ATP6V1FNB n=1 Tax=Amblyraja radiata TaxID=386614 RepID=UPI0014027A97|nr:protein ATP6V1FNB [Amblyraja radiata]
MDTQVQNFWKESITKEDLLRMCWLRQFKGNLSQPPEREIVRKKIPTLPHIPLQTQEPKAQEKVAAQSAKEKCKKPAAEKKPANESLSDMRPVSPEVRELLYDGFSKEDKGRYLYLKARKKKGPSEKYEYPLTSSWNYGWKIEEDVEYKKPNFGRTALVETAFYRRNGIFPKPEALN